MELVFTTDLNEAIKKSDIVFITVNTPTLENDRCDLSHVFEASVSIAGAMDDYKIIVIKSQSLSGPAGWSDRNRR
jgi:UDPglucose 6-dehydrogenase